ncbi:MAG TPA: hypothetical protein EYH45_05895 [Candidatus Caldiarchaeum subterraneum]|uniref:Isoprenylcysteine carboxylmethyltransferase family protein n=1 Tax=Caldiarchaeum subterraneum TaxID=311458 RepID=A0A833A4U2_CALS0|nr:hypothetical protein [Candidatus Caldarchaeum subterraneum]
MKRLLIYASHLLLFTVFVPYVMYLLATLAEPLMGFKPPAAFTYILPIPGYALILLGLALMLRAEVDMYMHSGGTPFPFYNPTERLVREGIYACTRNPMYLGTTLEYCGLALALNRLLMLPIALATLGLAMTLYFMHEKPKIERLNSREALEYLSSTPLLIPRAKCLKQAFFFKRGEKPAT